MRNCNNCLYRLRCITYAPVCLNNFTEIKENRSFTIQKEQNLDNTTEVLTQENTLLKQKVQDLENEILKLTQGKNIEVEVKTNKIVSQEEKNIFDLQVYENKNPEVYQKEQTLLKPKKGIFGTKFVEDKPKK